MRKVVKTRIFIEPLDVLLFRKAGTFSAGEDFLAESRFLPLPSTVAGAIRTKILLENCDNIHNYERNCPKIHELIGDSNDPGKLNIRGVFPAKRQNGKVKEFFPVPRDLVKVEDGGEERYAFSEVREITDGKKILTTKEHLRFETLPSSKFLTTKGLGDYLQRNIPESTHLRSSKEELFRREPRVGTALHDEKRTTKEGFLYRISFLRFRRKCGFSVWIGNEEVRDFLPEKGMLKLGGENRGAHYETLEGKDFKPPKDLISTINQGGKFRLYVLTPFFSGSNWKMRTSLLEDELAVSLNYKGGALGDPVLFGGWDVKLGRPKPTQRLIPPGSVYFFEIEEGEIDPNVSLPLTFSTKKSQLGFNACLLGRW